MQIYGENNLLEVKYKSSFKLNNQQLSLINNGIVNNLEQKLNAQLNSFNSKIQKILFNLFLQQYYDSKNQRSFIFQEYQSLPNYFNGFKHQLDTFEIRIQILIQIFCVYLLKIELNFDQSFSQNDVILINSNKQIKLDMFQFQTNIQFKNNQSNQSINEEQHSLLKYFELLIPKKVYKNIKFQRKNKY
ncbi:unnamed protein product [Paramecium pentaurelia]|uniref:Uncharacterized protein n=1 Tax=Paramecium pentaurelia TaxID=43138 RepID=A0A8S1TKB2_9CILI|nr:unnamed protein product [Paramecium pentaurelia]